MDELIAALIASTAAVIGAVVGGWNARRVASEEREARTRDDLRIALVQHWHAQEILAKELRLLPAVPPSRVAVLVKRVLPASLRAWFTSLATLRVLDWMLVTLSRRLVPNIEGALTRYQETARYLLFSAPSTITSAVSDTSELLERLDEREVDPTWWPAWDAARARLLRYAQTELTLDPSS